MARGILVVGSINVDMMVVAPTVPAVNEYVHATGFRMVIGGKGANQAIASHRLGSPTWLLARTGSDPLGVFLTESLEAEGVSTSLLLRTPEAASGVALIVVEESTGANTIVVDPGANRALAVDDLRALDTHYGEAGVALFQLEVPVEVSIEASRRARERGVLTILDSGPATRADSSVAPSFDVISPNEHELAALSGREVAGVASAAGAASDLLGMGARVVVVKMGGAGALLVEAGKAWHVPAHQVRCVDSTGAGDAFTAGLACALAEGMELAPAVRFANAAGAVAVGRVGTQPSMPDRGQVEELLESQPLEVTEL
jgi:ribokinase